DIVEGPGSSVVVLLPLSLEDFSTPDDLLVVSAECRLSARENLPRSRRISPAGRGEVGAGGEDGSPSEGVSGAGREERQTCLPSRPFVGTSAVSHAPSFASRDVGNAHVAGRSCSVSTNPAPRACVTSDAGPVLFDPRLGASGLAHGVIQFCASDDASLWEASSSRLLDVVLPLLSMWFWIDSTGRSDSRHIASAARGVAHSSSDAATACVGRGVPPAPKLMLGPPFSPSVALGVPHRLSISPSAWPASRGSSILSPDRLTLPPPMLFGVAHS